MTRKTLVLATGLLLALAASLPGQNPAASPVAAAGELATETGSFGFESQEFWISAPKFVSMSGNMWAYNSFDFWFSNLDGGYLAQIDLPAGARVTTVVCTFRDSHVAGDGRVRLKKEIYHAVTHEVTSEFFGSLETTGAGVGQIENASGTFDVTIRYREGSHRNTYFLQADLESVVRFRGCRVVWNRQVSPAPASATFADVPVGHLYHPFVEALVDAGITAGCGGRNYCVNAPITRGEMAVFLAVALGLHFPF